MRVYFILIECGSIPGYNRLPVFQWVQQDVFKLTNEFNSWASPESIMLMMHCNLVTFRQIVFSVRNTVRTFSGNPQKVFCFEGDGIRE